MNFQYSYKYEDQLYEYRLVEVPMRVGKITEVMSEPEWRRLGVTQNPDWIHYANYTPDNVMIFRRELKKAA